MVVERLHEARNLWLATARSDGRPHLAPVWFVYVEDRIWIGTGLASVRVRNLRSNPAASACLEQGDEPLVAEGTVLIHEAVRPASVVEAFRTKYDWDITVEVDNDIGQVALLEFRPHHWLFGLALPTVSDGGCQTDLCSRLDPAADFSPGPVVVTDARTVGA